MLSPTILDDILKDFTEFKYVDSPNEASVDNARVIINRLNLTTLVPTSVTFSYLGGIEFLFRFHRGHCTIDCLNDSKILVYFFKFGYIKTQEILECNLDLSLVEIQKFIETKDD